MFTFNNPYGKLTGGRWIKGNLHVHTTNSDGSLTPQQVIDCYESLGYGFLMLADHDYFTSSEELGAYHSESMILIPGNEITRNGPHILHVNAGTLVEPLLDRQKAIDSINADGGLAVLNHPNWLKDFNHCPQHSIDTWQEYTGIEIFNGTIHTLPGSPYATDRWDMVLADRRRIWGFAGDDAHEQEEIGRGWIVVYTQEFSVEGIMQSLKNGSFYASTGVVIKNIEVDLNCIKIETENARKIVAVVDYNYRLKEVEGKEIQLEFEGTLPRADKFKMFCHPNGRARYIRFECWGETEQFAWTQPFFIREA